MTILASQDDALTLVSMPPKPSPETLTEAGILRVWSKECQRTPRGRYPRVSRDPLTSEQPVECRLMESGRRQKRVSEPNPITVDGFDMIWEKRHPLFHDWRKELKGVSVSVWIRPGKTKELVLDVHFAIYGIDRMPNPDRWNQVLAQAIRSAMEAGWDPESRGSAFRHTPV